MCYTELMDPIGSVSHERQHETIEAKARWFGALTPEQRLDLFCAFTDLALTVDPTIAERKHVEPVAGRIQVLPAP